MNAKVVKALVKLTFEQAIAFWKLGMLSSEKLPGIAAEALESGFDSRSLRILAGEKEQISSTLDPLLSRAVAELGLPLPDARTAAKVVAACYAARILDGSCTPYEGASRIWWDVAIEFDKDPEIWDQVKVFVGLASEWEDYPSYRAEYEKDIMEAATSLVQVFRPAQK